MFREKQWSSKRNKKEEETKVRSWNDAGEYATETEKHFQIWNYGQRGVVWCYNTLSSPPFTPDLSDPTKPKPKIKKNNNNVIKKNTQLVQLDRVEPVDHSCGFIIDFFV